MNTKKLLKILECLSIFLLGLYMLIYIFPLGDVPASVSVSHIHQDDVSFEFQILAVTVGTGFILALITYIMFRFRYRIVPLILTVINGVLQWIIIDGIPKSDLLWLFKDDYTPINALNRFRTNKDNAVYARDELSAFRCEVGEILCVIILIVIAIMVIYAIVIIVIMSVYKILGKDIKLNEVEKKRKVIAEGKISVIILRIINICLGLGFAAIMIYYSTVIYMPSHPYKDGILLMIEVNIWSAKAYIFPILLIFIFIVDRWLAKGKRLKPLLFYMVYSYCSYCAINGFFIGFYFINTAVLYTVIVSIVALMLCIVWITEYCLRISKLEKK